MLKVKFILSGLLFAAASVCGQKNGPIVIETNHAALVLTAMPGQRVTQSYFGKKLEDKKSYTAFKGGREVYLTAGMDNQFEPAIRMVHNDGNPSLDLRYVSHEITRTGNITTTIVKLKDPQYPAEVALHYTSYANEDVISSHAEIRHSEKKPVLLTAYASSVLHFNADEYWRTQFHGDWAREMNQVEEKLTNGIKTLESKLGTRTNFYNTQAFFASEYYLQPGEIFNTPDFIYTYSANGNGQASRNLHRWARNYGVLNGNGPRLTLLNNWEATHTSFDEKRLVDLFDEGKKLGIDLFLHDDGWFGNKFPRDDDKNGLGDWQEDKRKLWPQPTGARSYQPQSSGLRIFNHR